MEDPNRVSQETAADEALAADVEEIDETEEGAEQPEKAEGEAPATEASEPEQDEDEPRKRNRKSARERISEITRQRREAEERARRAEQALKELKRPSRHEFDTDEEYEDAREDWNYARRRAREERENMQRTVEVINRDTMEEYRRHASAFSAEAPDYHQVATTAPISDPVANIIASMGEDGPRVAYALGKDHALAREISELHPTLAAIELGRLAMSRQRPQRRLQSKAPPPVAPVTNAGGNTQRDPAKMSPAEYRAWREGRN